MSTKILTLFILALCLAPCAMHGATVFEEDFSDNFNDTVDNANDDFQAMSQVSVASSGQNANWHLFAFSGNTFARVNGFGADVASDDWLFTPALNLTGATSATLNFQSAYNFNGPDIVLKVSTNYNPAVHTNPASATWTDLSFTLPSTGNFTFAASGNVDLTPHISASTYVAWRYISTGTASDQARLWEVDDIVVFTDGVQTGGEGEGEGVIEGEGEGEPVSVGEGDMIISEYVEGTSNNKAIEIFNGKTTTESLTGYSLALFSNGVAAATVEVDLTDYAASLPARGTLVIANSQAGTTLLALADGTCAFPDCPVTFNGNDAVALYKNGLEIDVVGVIGEDPGTAWVSGANSTQNQTLRRKSFVCAGNPDGFAPLSVLQSEWNTFATDTFSGLGSHAIDCTLEPEGEPEGSGEGEGEGEGEGDALGDCTEVFSEDFESNFNSTTNNDLDNFEEMTRVSVSSTGDEADWHIFGAGDNQFARINGFGADAASDDWLITPAMNLTEYDGAVLTFDSAYNFGGPALEVLVSGNYNPSVHTNPGTATWTTLSATLPSTGNYTFASSGNVSLGSSFGPNTYVAFRYTSTGTEGGDGRVWEVDNISVCGLPEPPAGPSTFAEYTLELGANECLEVPNPGTAVDGDFTWTFQPEGGVPSPLAETGREYCIVGAQYSDAGVYRATYEDGAAKTLVTFTFYVAVVENLPVGGLFGLSAAAALVACAGALGLRRRK